jgi:hypothetical protein
MQRGSVVEPGFGALGGYDHSCNIAVRIGLICVALQLWEASAGADSVILATTQTETIILCTHVILKPQICHGTQVFNPVILIGKL